MFNKLEKVSTFYDNLNTYDPIKHMVAICLQQHRKEKKDDEANAKRHSLTSIHNG